MEVHDIILFLSSIGGVVGMLVGGGGLLAYFKLRAEIKQINALSRVSEADAAVKVGEAWSKLVDPLNERVTAQRKRIDELEIAVRERDQLIANLREEMAELRGQLRALGFKLDTGPLRPNRSVQP